jgi:hypothetical protein
VSFFAALLILQSKQKQIVMSRVITFARNFPATHPKKGEPTYFIEKIYSGIGVDGNFLRIPLPDVYNFLYKHDEYYFEPKHHTIRAGNRWKVGDKFSPRVWSGKSYRSPQITIAPDITITGVFDFKIEIDKDYKCVLINNCVFYEENTDWYTQLEALETLAKNDGLSLQDFKSWFNWGKPFTGQIICWNKAIGY